MAERGRRPRLDGRRAMAGACGISAKVVGLDQFPEPPADFDSHAVDAYHAIVEHLAYSRALAVVDLPLICMAASAWSRWVKLDAQVRQADEETAKNGFLSGLAQARAAAEKAYRATVGDLGLSPVSRMKTSGALQSSFFDLLSGPASGRGVGDAGGDDPFAPRNKVVSIR